MGGGVTISASPAKKKGQIFVAKGSAPWYNTEETWIDVNSVTNVDESVPGQATVTCDGRVFSMDNMFEDCRNLTSLDLSNFNTSKVHEMNNMFYNCNSLVSVDLSNLNTSKVIKMNNMFYRCKSISSLDVSSFNTSRVTDMRNMFFFCSSLTSLDLSNFDTSNVDDMYMMFRGCSGIGTIDLSNWDTSNVTNMISMFWGCDPIVIKGTIDMKSCTEYAQMFKGCTRLKNVNIKNPPADFESMSGLSSSQYTIVS